MDKETLNQILTPLAIGSIDGNYEKASAYFLPQIDKIQLVVTVARETKHNLS